MVWFMSELIRNEMVVQLCYVFQRLNFTDAVIGLWSLTLPLALCLCKCTLYILDHAG